MKVLILGAGEMASGVAHRLFRSGFSVTMTEVDEPLAVRRGVSFCTAVWDGQADIEGVAARLYQWNDVPFDPTAHVAVVVDPKVRVLDAWRPDVLVDARLLKRRGGTDVSQARLVISLGPGAVCGQEAHLVVETHRGHNLGRLIEEGSAAPDTGIPGTIGGASSQRVLRAPVTGAVKGVRQIGDVVKAGDLVATVADEGVHTPIAGVVRGLVRDGVHIEAAVKLGDVDPREDQGACFTLSDKVRTISGAVLEAILHRFPILGS